MASLKQDITDIINSSYNELLESENILETEYTEAKELIHVTLSCAYDDIYDKNMADQVIEELLKNKQHIYELNNIQEPHHHEFKVLVDVDDSEKNESVSCGDDLPYENRLIEFKNRELSGDQRTQEWLNQRNNYITASVVASASLLMGKVAYNNLLLEKGSKGQFKTFFGNIHTHHGNQFEPVTNDIYCYRNNTKIHEFGLIPHKTVPFLGASTDGVTNELRNIEIKSLTSRVINGKVKKEYYHQMQLQMECLSLDVTDFLEAKYYQYSCKEDFFEDFYYESSDSEQVEKGVMLELINLQSRELEYIYSPIELYTNDKALMDWLDNTAIAVAARDDVMFVREVYWRLDEYSCIEVKKDPQWLPTHYPQLKQFWDEVEQLRKDPDELTMRMIDVEEKKKAAAENKNRGGGGKAGGGGTKWNTICMI